MKKLNILLFILLFSSLLAAQNDLSNGIEKRMAEISSEAKGKVGAGIMLLETGETAWLNPQRHFPMQSVYKLPIAMAMLSKVDSGLFSLDSMILVKKSDLLDKNGYSPIRDQHPEGNFTIKLRELIRYAIAESDGTASDVLMRLSGSSHGVMKYLSGLGLKDIHVVNTENEMGKDFSAQYKNYSTPRDAIKLLSLIGKGGIFKPETQKVLLEIMTGTVTGTKRIKGLLPKGTEVAHKTGTSGSRNGVAPATNDIGIITLPNGRHLLVAVFVSDSKAPESVREGVIAKIAKLGWDKWTANESDK